MNLSSDL